ncbi:hypothetical protein F9L16_23515 [Agarivorans sp. B2Z047]|uniref:hypothetical protein n=1 Tax=Agarivorans sp. B2Z047 TaxID=2652721 RepID=UPI00128C1DA6|nr:hypothetical protein [Agarivorans sp. B2Z047]MPW31926.1 hypothetical protein [Agarivorans sp. B2Z047]UQN41896.1 hypothetical protein LQZ07_19270 [Agarivorans sp. B2Z047]
MRLTRVNELYGSKVAKGSFLDWYHFAQELGFPVEHTQQNNRDIYKIFNLSKRWIVGYWADSSRVQPSGGWLDFYYDADKCNARQK